MNSQKGFAPIIMILTIVGVLVLGILGAGIYSWQTKSSMPIVGGDTDEHGCKGSAGYSWCAEKNKCLRIWKEPCIVSKDETADWQIYRNEEYGFEFKYPTELSITTDKIVQEFPQVGKKWYRVELSGVNLIEKPKMRFEINPDGYGPFFPDKFYKLSLKSDGTVVILLSEANSDENANDGYFLAMSDYLTSQKGDVYSWMFSFKEGNSNYEILFNQILSTFKFISP